MSLSFSTTLLLATSGYCWLYWLWSRRHFYKLSFQFPTIWGVPLLGVAFQAGSLKKVLPYITDLWQRLPYRSLLLWCATTPVILTVDPTVVEQVLTKPDFTEKSSVFYAPVRDALQGSMLASAYKEGQPHRKIFGSTVRNKQLLSFMPTFNAKSKEFLGVVENMCRMGGGYEVLNHLRLCTFAITKETTMGHTKHNEPEMMRKVLHRLIYTFRGLFLEMILSCANLRFLIRLNPKFSWNQKKLHEFADEIMLYRAKNMEFEDMANTNMEATCIKSEPLIFIDQAIKYHKAGQISWNKIIGEANVLLVASFETTSSAVHSVLFLLATHPDIQERVYAEICATFPSKDFEVQIEDLKKLTYVEMVINEALRLFPPVPLLARETHHKATLTVDGRSYTLPRNMHVAVDVYHIHREPSIWGSRPNDFDPDNFLPDKVSERHSYTFLAFSKGPRNCMGWNYAYFSIKVLLSHILRNYSVHTSFKYQDINPKFILFLEYRPKPLLSFKRRD